MEPTRQTVRAIMSPRRAAHSERSAEMNRQCVITQVSATNNGSQRTAAAVVVTPLPRQKTDDRQTGGTSSCFEEAENMCSTGLTGRSSASSCFSLPRQWTAGFRLGPGGCLEGTVRRTKPGSRRSTDRAKRGSERVLQLLEVARVAAKNAGALFRHAQCPPFIGALQTFRETADLVRDSPSNRHGFTPRPIPLP